MVNLFPQNIKNFVCLFVCLFVIISCHKEERLLDSDSIKLKNIKINKKASNTFPSRDNSFDIGRMIAGLITEIISVPPTNITLNTHLFNDLDLDNLEFIDLVMAIETEFDISIEDNELENFQTVNDIVNYVFQNMIEEVVVTGTQMSDIDFWQMFYNRFPQFATTFDRDTFFGDDGGSGGIIKYLIVNDDSTGVYDENFEIHFSKTKIDVSETYEIVTNIKRQSEIPARYFILEMQRAGSGISWVEIYKDDQTASKQTHIFTRIAWSPGVWNFKAKLIYEDNSVREIISRVNIEEQYPHIDKFKNNPTLRSHLSSTLWNNTINYAQANQSTHAIREYGCFIYLSRDGTYYAGNTIEGPVVYLTGQPGSTIMAYVPFEYNDRSYYHPLHEEDIIVGTMHTHYPLTWAGAGVRRFVGPSGPDNSTDLPGIGYDYTFNLISGHNVNASKDFFTHGTVRRQTP